MRPTDVTDGSMSHHQPLAFCSHTNTRPTPTRVGFLFPESIQAGSLPLPSLCSLRIDGRGLPLSLEPRRLSRGEEVEGKAEHESAKRLSSYRAAGAP